VAWTTRSEAPRPTALNAVPMGVARNDRASAATRCGPEVDGLPRTARLRQIAANHNRPDTRHANEPCEPTN
jgi:hypothetical protein